MLRKNFFSKDELLAIIQDFRTAGLPAEEVAVMALAQKAVTQPYQVAEQEFEELRGFGFSDEEIMDVVMTATARGFFSKTLDAFGARPDDVFLEMDPDLRQALAIGRPFP